MTLSPHRTEICLLAPGERKRSAIRRAVEVVRAGGVIAFPTETVYGLGCDINCPEAVERIRRIKGQPPEKPFQLLIATPEEMDRWAARPLPRAAVKLARCFWPGPLTLVAPDRSGGTVGLRLPDHADVRAILRESGTALAATSANRSGEQPARTAEEVAAAFDGQVELILDGGPAPLGAASTVVRAGVEDGIEILREGALAADEVREAAGRILLFVEEPQSCGMALAARIARFMLHAQACAATVWLAVPGREPEAETLPAAALAELLEMGYPDEPLPARPLDFHALDRADELFTATPERIESVGLAAPWLAGRCHLLPDAHSDIAPPGDPATVGPGYRQTAVRLESAVWTHCRRIAASA